jgi:D-arabinose 1-dehydrogenase-like Zn-dependent alcohol dehydrogenase
MLQEGLAMPLMKAIQIKAPGADFQLVEKEIPQPGEDQVLIKVAACGVCHGDALAKEGHFPGTRYPTIPGHEVVGIIDAVGSLVTNWAVGQRVGVGWHGGHCFHCSACQKGDFGACEQSLTTGLSTYGGYAQYMVARREVLVSIPDSLDAVDAAPLLCAGRTTFGALKSCGAEGGDLVAIQGLGGLGHLAVQYAVRLGFRTVALSRGRDKEESAYKLGAHGYIDTLSSNVSAELLKLGGAKVILCTAPNGKAISELLGGLGRKGQAIIVAGASDIFQVPLMLLLMGERSISGFVGGNLEETIRFSTLFGIKPMVEVFPLEEAARAYEKMMTSRVRFRAVIEMQI